MGGQITYLNFLTNFDPPPLFGVPIDSDRMLPAGRQEAKTDGFPMDSHDLGLRKNTRAQHGCGFLAPGAQELAIDPESKARRREQGHCEHKPAVTGHVQGATGGASARRRYR